MATMKTDPRSHTEHEAPHTFYLPDTDDIEDAIWGEEEDDEDAE